jgi:hypothetical protein
MLKKSAGKTQAAANGAAEVRFLLVSAGKAKRVPKLVVRCAPKI